MKKRKLSVKIILIIALCFIIVGCIGCTIITLELYSQAYGRVEEFSEMYEFSTYFFWDDMDQNKYTREEVFFNSGGNKLQGFIYGESNINGLVIISQGMGSTADCYLPLVMYFVDNGWRVFAYNNTGVAGSEGEGIRGLTQSVIDLDAALIYVKNSGKFSGLPIMLIGHSWGGFAVTAVLNYNHDVKASVSFAGYNNSRERFKEAAVIELGGIFYVLSPQTWAIEKQLFGDTAKLNAIDGINKANIPVIIVQSSNDDEVLPNTTSIYAHRNKITNPYVEIVYLEGEDAAGHEFVCCSKEQREYMKWADASWEVYEKNNTGASRLKWAEEINFDKFKANELNMELFDRINIFFNNAR